MKTKFLSLLLAGVLVATGAFAQDEYFPNSVRVNGCLAIGATYPCFDNAKLSLWQEYDNENPTGIIGIKGMTITNGYYYSNDKRVSTGGLAIYNENHSAGGMSGAQFYNKSYSTTSNGGITGLYVNNYTDSPNATIYGIRTEIQGSGGSPGNRWAGYFSGGDMYVSGSFGLGTTLPAAKLHIVSTDNTDAAILASTTSNNSKLVVRSETDQIANGAVFRLLHESSAGGRNNPSINFHRGAYSSSPGFLTFSTSGEEQMRIDGLDITIGSASTNPFALLTVHGHIRASSMRLSLNAGADFVFESDYRLRPLSEVEQFITENRHLPDIAPADSMVQNGVNMGELQVQLLQKIEELTLYIIEQDKKIDGLKNEVENLKK